MIPVPAMLFAHTLRVLTGLEPDPAAEDEDAIEIQAIEARYIEATWPETVVRGRPWVPHKRIGTVEDGTRFVVKGVVESRDDQGCHGKPWYAVYPFGYVCSESARETDEPPTPGAALQLPPDKRVPYDYAFVRADGVPMYASYADIDAGVPTRPLTKGMSLVATRSLEYDGAEWIQTQDGAFVPRDGIRYGGGGSEWAGVELRGRHVGPSFAWTLLRKGTPVRAAPEPGAIKVLELELRTRVPLLEDREVSGRTYWRVGEDLWIDGEHLNEVHLLDGPPPEVLDDWRGASTGNDQWIDVDLGEQVLVAYRGDRAVFATLISSGKAMATPRGNYPVWAKVASTTMANQAYEDNPYMVQGVPWVVLFQGHNALHGAYWHDNFGNRKSHGCVNLAPYDARYVFEWIGPTLPHGWTGYLPGELRRAVVVHVRDSSKATAFVQERPIGPPDREAEKAKAEEAELRRAEAAIDTTPQYDPAFVPGGVVVDPDAAVELPEPETATRIPAPPPEPRTGLGLPG